MPLATGVDEDELLCRDQHMTRSRKRHQTDISRFENTIVVRIMYDQRICPSTFLS